MAPAAESDYRQEKRVEETLFFTEQQPKIKKLAQINFTLNSRQLFFWSTGRVWYIDLDNLQTRIDLSQLGFVVDDSDENSSIQRVFTSSNADKVLIRVRQGQSFSMISWDVNEDLEFEGFQHASSDLDVLQAKNGDAYVREQNHLYVIEQGCCLASFDLYAMAKMTRIKDGS